MNFFFLSILTIICIALLAWGMNRKDGVYQFPFLAGATFLSFVLPQMIGLQFDLDLPEGGLEKAFVMTILCVSMCYLGYSWKPAPLRSFNWDFDDQKLMQASVMLTLIGAYFFFEISRLPEEMTSASMWSGVTVAYLFFAQILTYGFAIAVLLYFRTRSLSALVVALFGSLFYLDRIVIAGRRGVALEFIFILVMGWWFGRKRILPKSMVFSAIVLGTLGLYSTGDYRSIAQEEDGLHWSNLRTIPFVENLHRLVTQGGEEMRNVVYTIEGIDRTGDFDLGLFHWNTLVFNYVPAQIVGVDFKNSLMVETRNVSEDVFGFQATNGSTTTGMVDAFGSFWYVGCLKFFFIAFIMRKIYSAATQGGITAQLLYMLILMPALHCITHHTQWFLTPWVHMGLFLFPALYLSRTHVVLKRAVTKGSDAEGSLVLEQSNA